MSVGAGAEPAPPLRQRDGVSARLDTATSGPALDAIEFADALAVIASFAAGPLGAAAIRALGPTSDRQWIAGELARVGEVLAVLRRGLGFDVVPVPELRGALSRLRLDGTVLEIGELAAVRQSLAAARAIAAELEHHADAIPAVSKLREPPLDRAVERTLERAVSDDGELLDGASPGLASARREVHSARARLIRRLEAMLRDADPAAVPAGATVTMRSGRYVIPVRRDSRQRPDGIVHDESGSAGTLFVEPTGAIDLGNALRAAITAEERATLVVLRELTQLLRPHRAQIAALHAMAVEVDTIVARARWAHRVRGDVPSLSSPGGAVQLRGARHPLLLAREIEVVPFDLIMDPSEHTVLISGPNTGGKTVLLKTVGLVIALTQSGCVPSVGPESIVPVVTRMFVDIGDHQSLAADLSTFSAHVAALRQLLDHADASTLVLLDEIGSGTDPAEGGALATAVLETLTARGALTLATTHLGALKTLATRVPGLVNGSLHFDAATLAPTYRFIKGVPGRSYGLAIARRLGVDADVLARADELVPAGERELDRLLAEVETRRHALDRDETAVRERAEDLAHREARAAAAELAVQQRDADLRQQEKTAERDRIRQAKAYLLEARKQVETALALAQGAADDATARRARQLVEDGVRAQARLLDEPDVGDVGAAAALQPGTRVRLNTGATGDVVELRADGRAVVRVGVMRLLIAAATLTPLPSDSGRRARALVPGGDVPEAEPVQEIDLRGLRADEAHGVVVGAIDRAVLADQPQLAIIHGMGTGALRAVVRELLAADRRVASFDFAPRQQGGAGVTVAILR